ncbi:MAG: FAD binding domain-containing protein [Oscillospiraceae bacterium]|nr:FAD binding domain-containing protein [Oscillospiraceae bacterium]
MLPAFELLTPTTIAEACKMKLETKGKLLAGGTDILVGMHGGKERYETLIDLKGIEELKGFDTKDGLDFGALTPHREFEQSALIKERYTALYEGCSQVGSSQIRIRGTVGGNICNAAPSADSIGPLLVFGATCVIAGADGRREVPLSEFFTGPKKTVLGESELLERVLVPSPVNGSGSAYTKYTRRRAMDLALLGVSCYVVLDAKGKIEVARIALTTAAPTPIRATNAEEFLVGKTLDDAVLGEISELVAKQAKPRSSWRSSAEFRIELVKELTVRTLRLAEERAKGEA